MRYETKKGEKSLLYSIYCNTDILPRIEYGTLGERTDPSGNRSTDLEFFLYNDILFFSMIILGSSSFYNIIYQGCVRRSSSVYLERCDLNKERDDHQVKLDLIME